MSFASKKFGVEGEDFAVDLLKSKGYEIIERNYHFGKGEIDIIALDPVSNYTVFVEVKSRKNLEYGEPEFGVTKTKIKQLKKVAELYLYDKDIRELDCRFDVITVLFRSEMKPLIKHYINAFD
jgi:putative endonuclease